MPNDATLDPSHSKKKKTEKHNGSTRCRKEVLSKVLKSCTCLTNTAIFKILFKTALLRDWIRFNG